MHTLLMSNMSTIITASSFSVDNVKAFLFYTHKEVSKPKETTQNLPCNILKTNTPVKLGWNWFMCCFVCLFSRDDI